jgi:uncharacterized membrane protein
MHLPVFDIPIPNLGFDIPVLLHPPIVHFAIVIPVFILLLELINIIMKRRGLTITTFLFFTMLIVIFFAAFVTGKTDGSETWDMLTKAGQEDLKEHKLIGIYLMLATVVVMFAKLFAMAIRKWWMKLIYLLILIGFVAAVLYQGKEGGELVYKYGANNEMVQTLSEEVFDLKEELEELKEESGNVTEESTEASEEKAQESVETKETSEKAEEPAKAEEKPAPAEEPAATDSDSEKTESTPVKEDNTTTKSETVTEKAIETAKEVTNTASQKAAKTTEKVKEMAKEAVESTKEAGTAAIDAAKKMMSSETQKH